MYNPKARRSDIDLSTFSSDKAKFNKQVTTLVDKIIEDNNTFKTKYSRIVVINLLTNGLTNRILET